MSTRLARVGAAAAIAAAAMLIVVPSAWSQAAPSISVSPNAGAAGSQFTITLNNYKACAADSPNCIIITFTQGAATPTQIGTADSKGAATFTGTLTVPPGATPGAATIRARSNIGDDASTGFNVTAPGTTTAPTTTSTSSSTSSTSTSTSTSSTSSTTTSTIFFPTTTVPLKTKKSSSHSDVPRYIAVGLVVLAAAATAAVDTRLRHLRA